MDEGLLPKIVMKKSHSTSRIILKQNSYFFLCVHLIFASLRLCVNLYFKDNMLVSFIFCAYPKVTSNIPEKERTSPINRRKVNRSFKNIAARINIKITLV